MSQVYVACQNVVSVTNAGIGAIQGEEFTVSEIIPTKAEESVCSGSSATEAAAKDRLAAVVAGKCRQIRIDSMGDFVSCQAEGEIQVSSKVQAKKSFFTGLFASLIR